MSLLFHMLPRFVIAFLPKSKCVLISWLQSPSPVILDLNKIKSVSFHFSPIYLPWSHETGCQNLKFWMLNFKPAFTFLKRIFICSLLSAIWVVSSAYLRLLIFLLAISISACASSSLAFLMMYSAYKLNKQGDNIEPCHTPFPILNQFIVSCLTPFLFDLHTGFSGGR